MSSRDSEAVSDGLGGVTAPVGGAWKGSSQLGRVSSRAGDVTGSTRAFDPLGLPRWNDNATAEVVVWCVVLLCSHTQSCPSCQTFANGLVG